MKVFSRLIDCMVLRGEVLFRPTTVPWEYTFMIHDQARSTDGGRLPRGRRDYCRCDAKSDGRIQNNDATLFWVGELSDSDNALIPNDVSYWDRQWQLAMGLGRMLATFPGTGQGFPLS